MSSTPGFLRSTTFLAILSCLLWSSAFPGIKIGLQYTPPLQFAGLRFMASGLMILPFCGSFSLYLKNIKENSGIVILVALFQTTLTYTLLYQGMNMLPSAIAAIITGSQPLIIAVMAHFVARSERMTSRRIVSILLGFSGVTIIALTRGEITLSGTSQFLGLLLLLLSNASSGIGNILVSRSKSPLPPLVLTSSQLFLGGLIIFLCSLPVEGPPKGPLPGIYYISLLWLSFLSTLAFSLWFILLKRKGVGVADLNLWLFLIPVAGACLSWMVLPGESPELFSVLGMVCIALALLILNIGKRAQRHYSIYR